MQITRSRDGRNPPAPLVFVIIHPGYSTSYRIWFSSPVNAITSHVSVSHWAWLKFFRVLTRAQSSSARLRLPVLVYLHAGCSFAGLPTITYVSLMLEYIFKLPFPVSWKPFDRFSLLQPPSNFPFDPEYHVPFGLSVQAVSLFVFRRREERVRDVQPSISGFSLVDGLVWIFARLKDSKTLRGLNKYLVWK